MGEAARPNFPSELCIGQRKARDTGKGFIVPRERLDSLERGPCRGSRTHVTCRGPTHARTRTLAKMPCNRRLRHGRRAAKRTRALVSTREPSWRAPRDERLVTRATGARGGGIGGARVAVGVRPRGVDARPPPSP